MTVMADRNFNAENEKIEAVKPKRIPLWRMVIDQAGVTPEILSHHYPGSGTEEDPYLISWIPHDPRNPMTFSPFIQWAITMIVAFATLAVALVSSAYSGGVRQIMEDFDIGTEVATLGLSLFVLGFAIGPLLWAPMSEMFGRQVLFIGTYAALTAFNAGAAGAQNVQTLIIMRFFAGAFGSSPLTNAGGVIADMFPASKRGLAMSVFAAAPFLGPIIGPMIGGFLGMNAGWQWVMGLLAAFSGTLWIAGSLLIPETYAPVLLRRRATKMSKMTGKVYVSKVDADRGKITLAGALRTNLSRPWILLLKEPIVTFLSIYMAIIYGTLYMLFGAFPIVYEEYRGWNQGVGGLAFLGIMVGMILAILYNIIDNKRYIRTEEEHNGFAPPEARLPPTIVGSMALPIGLFWFAWTNGPNIHWIVSILAGVPFGFGMVLVFLSVLNYLIDAYTIFAASVLAANAVLRSCFGAGFPLFTTYMYRNLGIHWASSIPAFLALACVPFPFLFYRYGAAIRSNCKYAAESAEFMRQLQNQDPADELEQEAEEAADAEAVFSRRQSEAARPTHSAHHHRDADENHRRRELDMKQEREEEEGEGEIEKDDKIVYNSIRNRNSNSSGSSDGPGLDLAAIASRTRTISSTRTGTTIRRTRSDYEGNPYDIDRVNTRQSDFSILSRKRTGA